MKTTTKNYSKPLKVGIVGPIPIHRYRGGISQLLEAFLKQRDHLLEDGIDVHLINTCVVPRSNDTMGKFKWINFYNFYKLLSTGFRSIKHHKTELLHVHSSVCITILKDALAVLFFKVFFDVRAVLQIHSAEIMQTKFKVRVLDRFCTWVLNRAYDSIIVFTKTQQQFLKSKFHGRVEICSNFIPSFNNSMEVNTLSKSHINITFLGSIENMKGIMDLLSALSSLKKLPWKLTIAGEFKDDSYRQMLLNDEGYQKINDRIQFTGYVKAKEKYKLLSHTDILVLPSYAEGMPVSILEGLSYGVAIVATDVGANADHFSSICNLIQPGDIAGLTHELEQLMMDAELLAKRKNQAYKLANNYTFEALKSQLLPIYQTI